MNSKILLAGLGLLICAPVTAKVTKTATATKSTVAVKAPVATTPAPVPATPAVIAKLMSSGETDIGTLMDTPAAKAVLQKYIPDVISNPQMDMARTMTLKQIQSYIADKLTDDTLAKIDADLAKLPAGK